jgi:hypothetical protein
MAPPDMTLKEVKSIVSQFRDQELRDGLTDIFRQELIGSRSQNRHPRDVGRLRR